VTVTIMDLEVRKGARVIQPVLVQTNGATVALPAGTTAKMQIRSERGSTVVLDDLSTVNGRLTIDVAAALVTITIPSAVSAAFTFERAVYDLDLIYTAGNERDRIAEGKVYVFPAVTQ
jgi:hypothetical protein